ncbi:MAG: T9SS type A sorting domain-containing protein [Bacteroidetes bacterium]|nr:T9SS type A sorting domain-containing protein [Bacteroidota bacterium]
MKILLPIILSLTFITSISFSQCYTADSILYAPESNAGTPALVNIDDQWSGVIPIGFTFCFYGDTFNQCVIGSNEVISFNLANASGYNTWPISAAIPSTTPADLLNSIMAPWQDVDASLGGAITYNTSGTTPNRKFVVSFNNIPMFSATCNNLTSTSQIILYETSNVIEIHILNKDTCTTWNSGAAIEGIQDATGTLALAVPGRNYPTQWVATNDGYRFTPGCAPCGNPISVNENNQSEDVLIYPNPAGNEVTLSLPSNQKEKFSLVMRNVLGQEILNLKNISGTTQINIANIHNGIYLIELTSNNSERRIVEKLVVEK